MSSMLKKIEDMTVSDFATSSVWEYALEWEDSLGDETWVRPVADLPVVSLGNRVAGTRVRLNNGTERWAILSNVALRNPHSTRQFLTASIEKDDEWFGLARYFDVDYSQRGPNQLASFLGLPVEEVFPITYDISDFAVGDPCVLTGIIPLEPEEKLSEEELISLSLEEE